MTPLTPHENTRTDPRLPDEKTNRFRKRMLTVCLLMAVTGSISAAAWRWSSGVDAQNHAVRVMYAVLTDFLDQNQGRWPRDWQELRQMPSAGHWYDPINFDVMEAEVDLDFHPDLTEMAEQSAAEFTAIRAKRPVFDFSKDPRLIVLLSKVREFHGETR